jgi:uncharacterized repeat protein (TIGR03803 family)
VSFSGANGGQPYFGSLIMDGSGNLYGTTSGGGAYGQGTVFELQKTSAPSSLAADPFVILAAGQSLAASGSASMTTAPRFSASIAAPNVPAAGAVPVLSASGTASPVEHVARDTLFAREGAKAETNILDWSPALDAWSPA